MTEKEVQSPNQDYDAQIKHLEFIQAIIERMATSSANAKSWLLPVATATYGYALVNRSIPVAFLGIAACLVFMLLDAKYLESEQDYRNLYNSVASGQNVPPFSLSAPSSNDKPWPSKVALRSWSVWPFYCALLFVGLLVIASLGR